MKFGDLKTAGDLNKPLANTKEAEQLKKLLEGTTHDQSGRSDK